jgi:hypothetical protein
MNPSTLVGDKSITVKFQKELHLKMQQHIINDGYGMRGKNKWILESIDKFLELPNYLDFVEIADEATILDEIISLRIPITIYKKLENALVEVRKKFPTMEGVKSKLVRASISQRIVRG